ncbi:MAG: hypothetical protein E5V72_01495 [Mesorhizobium sp.]|uniref:DNA-directed RNA polymerase subunit alpha C-terminal domain-containing protein n=1 Tax=Mesorhizobium sp. TaxID=1871066 RepID=UPI000FE5BD9C|nr:DNA-directed RNA polymerase subunit alpha C-terminal domain-containing protein [Mesorhizobium sp.]RWD43914.1 MAG: hypothetical protein EOS35_18730 [Mesorhizobium sp.]RWH50260.1 MAG: hypothetical protein EOQ80_04625 [Mesorhizobium sp.]RWI69693.1 MAG: hypothetical protein EOR18_20915 [Mesorhizobium sp.]RWI76160.1 MAG: hypothetical protein EOR19_18505 [Mesorhizobium sp.]RWJ33230.1 MAG: hypothetical protein EOR28_11635 [Mesorhizobium sp.]
MHPRDFIDDLELNVRTGNVLRNNDITTVEQFLQLTKPQVLSFKHAGARTWSEIREVQIELRRKTRSETLPARAIAHIRALNELQFELHTAGFFMRFDQSHRLRLGRYVNRDDFDDHG